MSWVAAGVTAGAIGGSLIAANSAGDAADTQLQGTLSGVSETRRQFNQGREDLAPYREAGSAALDRLRTLLGIGSTTDPNSGNLTRNFTAGDLESDPVYNSGLKFGLDEGTKALERRAAATGSYDSGAELKALTRFGNDYGSTKAGESYGRFRDTHDSVYGKLSGIAGMGSGATNVGVNAGSAAGQNLASLYTSGANASAASQIAQGNAISGGLNSIGQYAMLSSLSGGGQRTKTPAVDPLIGPGPG